MAMPTAFTDALFNEILARTRLGEPLDAMCREDKFPTSRCVRGWCEKDPELMARYLEAKDAGEYAIAWRAGQTARGKKADQGGDSTGDVQRDKLIIDTDLKLLAKFNPKRWGDRVQTEHSGKVTLSHEDFLNRVE